MKNADYEAEHGEVIIGDNIVSNKGKQLSSNAYKVMGKTHDQKNKLSVNGTGEDVTGGNFVFSNRIGVNGKSFASLVEQISRKKAKFEKPTNDYISKNTSALNIEKLDKQLEYLANAQENMKLGRYAYGGLVKFQGGGPVPKKKDTNKEEYDTANAIRSIQKHSIDNENIKVDGKIVKRKTLPDNHPLSTATKMRSVPRDNAVVVPLSEKAKADKDYQDKNKPLTLKRNRLLSKMQDLKKNNSVYEKNKLIKQIDDDRKELDKLEKENEQKVKIESAKVKKSYDDKLKSNVQQNKDLMKTPTVKDGAYSGYGNKQSSIPDKPKTDTTTVKPKVGVITKQQQSVIDNNERPDINNQEVYKPKMVFGKPPIGAKTGNGRIAKQANSNVIPKSTGTNPTIDTRAVLKTPSDKLDIGNTTPTDEKIITRLREQVNADLDNSQKANNKFSDSDILPLGLIGANYFSNKSLNNRLNTSAPAVMMQRDSNRYADYSGGARNAVKEQVGSINANPYANMNQRIGSFAAGIKATNDINNAELNRKLEFDIDNKSRNTQIDNINAQTLNNSAYQSRELQNAKLQLQADNNQSLFTNLNEYIVGKQKRKDNLESKRLLGYGIARNRSGFNVNLDYDKTN